MVSLGHKAEACFGRYPVKILIAMTLLGSVAQLLGYFLQLNSASDIFKESTQIKKVKKLQWDYF